MTCKVADIDCTVEVTCNSDGSKGVTVKGDGLSVNLTVSHENLIDSHSSQSPVALSDEILVEAAKQSFEQLAHNRRAATEDERKAAEEAKND